MSETGRSVADVIEAMLPLDFERHESQTIKDAAIRDRRALAVRLAAALAAASPDTAAPVDATVTEELEAACLEGLIETPHGYRYRPSIGAAAVERILAQRAAVDHAKIEAALSDAVEWSSKAWAVAMSAPAGDLRAEVGHLAEGFVAIEGTLRAAVDHTPEPTPALWQNARDAINAGQFPGADGGAE